MQMSEPPSLSVKIGFPPAMWGVVGMWWRAGAKPSPLQTSNGLRVYTTHVDVKIPVQVDSRTLPSCPGLLRGIQELTFQGFQLLLTLVGRDSLKVSVNMDENGCLIDTGTHCITRMT